MEETENWKMLKGREEGWRRKIQKKAPPSKTRKVAPRSPKSTIKSDCATLLAGFGLGVG
jgi:hypothetical protein